MLTLAQLAASRGLVVAAVHPSMPLDALAALTRVLTHGDAKHPGDGWRSVPAVEHFAALQRHVAAATTGNPDEETGESHWAHAACRVLFLLALPAERRPESAH